MEAGAPVLQYVGLSIMASSFMRLVIRWLIIPRNFRA